MRNEWRVDRSQGACPCGMASIFYLGESWRDARRKFHALVPGFNGWNQPDDTYGVLLSRWDSRLCEYVRVAYKPAPADYVANPSTTVMEVPR